MCFDNMEKKESNIPVAHKTDENKMEVKREDTARLNGKQKLKFLSLTTT